MPENPGSSEDDIPISDSELEELIGRYDQLEKDFKQLQTESQGELERLWKDLAGPLYHVMRESEEETLKYLRSPNPNLRQVAIHLACDYWRLTAILAKEYERIALDDPDVGPRGIAYLALGMCFSGTQDARIGHLLATASIDVNLPENLRIQALTALMELHGIGNCNGLYANISLGSTDWDLVRHYAAKRLGDGG